MKKIRILRTYGLGIAVSFSVMGCFSNSSQDLDSDTSTDDECTDDTDSDGCDDNDPVDGGECGFYDCEIFKSGDGYEFQNKDRPYLGNVDSPEITINLFSDFGCPYCVQTADMFTKIFADPKYSDHAALYYGHYPTWAPTAWQTHRAARAGYLQGYFWEVHDFLFDKFPIEEKTPKKQAARVEELIKSMGLLDMEQYRIDVESKEVNERIEFDIDEHEKRPTVKKNRFPSRPAVYINGFEVVPWDKTENVLDYLLEE